MASPKDQVILITGANGFIARHIIKQTLERGYSVRGTVRSESSGTKLLHDLSQYKDRLTFIIVPDMTKVEAYEKAFEGNVTGVLHTASPFVLDIEDNKRDILDPAIQGSVTILKAAQKYGHGAVRRVIAISSNAAALDITRGARPGYVYTDKDWNPMTYEEAATSDHTAAYCASKGLAEKAMWDWMEANKPESFTLTTILPAWVFGPHVPALTSVKALNESTQVLYALLGAKEVPRADFPAAIDVRDLARVNIAALETPEADGRRFLLGRPFDYQLAVDYVRREVPELKGDRLPVGRPGYREPAWTSDSNPAKKIFNFEYMPMETTMRDSFRELLEAEKAGVAA